MERSDGRVNVLHFLNVSSPEINFRLYYSQGLKKTYYQRMEAVSSSEHINEHAGSKDTVIIIVHRAANYLNEPHYTFNSINSNTFPSISSYQCTKHIWSNMELLYTKEQIKSLTAT